jgi:LmbE family N-acetylglucosaminyl deacetylase
VNASDSDKPTALVIVAHPDDEVIFFAGLILDRVASGFSVDVLSVTGRFFPSAMTSTRGAELRRACWKLGCRAMMFDVADTPGHLRMDQVRKRLKALKERYSYDEVYTHGLWGEYGHQHHRDVCLAVHQVFADGVFSLAGPLQSDRTMELTKEALKLKRQIASVYYSQPFAAEWCSAQERFTTVPTAHVERFATLDNDSASAAGVEAGASFFEEMIERFYFAFHSPTPFAELAHIPPVVWKPASTRFLAHLNAFRPRNFKPLV